MPGMPECLSLWNATVTGEGMLECQNARMPGMPGMPHAVATKKSGFSIEIELKYMILTKN